MMGNRQVSIMSQQEFILNIVSKLLHDKNNSLIKEELPTVICNLLKPFSKRSKASKQLDMVVGKMICSYGICGRCHRGKLKKPSDLFCKFCKSVLKDQAKKIIE